MAEEISISELSRELGYDSLSDFSKEWRALTDKDKEDLKAAFRAFKATK